MKWYHPGWIKDYLQHNNFIKISVSAILIFTIVGTFCWPLFLWELHFCWEEISPEILAAFFHLLIYEWNIIFPFRHIMW